MKIKLFLGETLLTRYRISPTDEVKVFSIGRGGDIKTPTGAGAVSRQHFLVRVAPDGLVLAKDVSRHGTVLNGTKMPSGRFVELQPGDRLELPSKIVALVE